MLSYLLEKGGMPLREAYTHVLLKRPIIGPNAGFMHALIDLEERIFQTATMQRPVSMHQRVFRCIAEEDSVDVRAKRNSQ